MDIKELNAFVDWEIARLDEYYGKEENEKLILADAVKVGEELGELFNEILAYNKYQRKEKLNKKTNMEAEFADVILTTFILAKRCDVDIEKSLKDKIEKIKSRDYKK